MVVINYPLLFGFFSCGLSFRHEVLAPIRLRGKGGRRGRGRGGRGNGGRKSDKFFHLCEKYGHEVLQCYHRYDKNNKGPRKNDNHNGSASAYLVTPESATDPAWYVLRHWCNPPCDTHT